MSKSTKKVIPRKKKKKSIGDNNDGDVLSNVAPLIKKEAPPSSTTTVLKLEREDQLILRLAYAELQNKQYQLRDAQREMEEVNGNWAKQLSLVNEKYNLDSTKDKIDLNTGEIKKG